MALQTSDFYRDLAERFIDKFPVAFGHIQLDQVLFLVETEKKPKKYADVRKVASPYNALMEYKFIMTFYEKIIDGMTNEQINMLMFHELLHIDEDFNKLRKHNLEDFLEITIAYGAMWDTDKSLLDILEEDELPELPEE